MNNQIINVERTFKPEIEGLRVVAALLVAVYHIWFNRVSGGVDVFFVISGYLITTSIISTINRTGEFRFWPYISKLMKRLFPSVFFILGIVLLLSFFYLPESIFGKTMREIIASMFYYQNWQLAISSTDYLDMSQMKSPVEHFWALSIQGQFYLIWFVLFSIIFYILKKTRVDNARKLMNAVLAAVFIISFIYSVYLTAVNQPWAYFITFTRVWEFALGGLICVNLPLIKLNKIAAVILGWFGLIGLILTGILFNVSEMFPGYIALWPMACAVFIVMAGTVDSKLGVQRFLGSAIMVKLGGISFGIYLWHWILLQFFRYNVAQTPGFFVGIAIILLSIILAYFTTYYIEKPIRSSIDNKYAFKRLGILGVANILLIGFIYIGVDVRAGQFAEKIISKEYPGAMAVTGSLVVPDKKPIPAFSEAFDDLPQSHLDGSNQGLDKVDVRVGKYGVLEDYEKTIAVVGSSHSEHWLGAVLEATKDSNYRVLSITRSGTRFSTGYPDGSEKDIWVENVVDYLKDADIDLLISHASASDSPYINNNYTMVEQLQYVKDEYDMDVLALRDVPRYEFNVLESTETAGIDKTKKRMNDEIDQKDEAFWDEFTMENDSLYKMDLTEYFTVDGEFQPVIGNVIVYRDNRHITNTFSKSFGPVFKEEIEEIFSEGL